MRSFLLMAWLIAGNPGQAVQIIAKEDPARPEVVALKAAANLPEKDITQEQGETVLRFAAVDPDTGKEGSAIWGSYERRGADLVFRPRHPLIPGNTYRAKLLGTTPLTSEYRVPQRKLGAPAFVKEFYPDQDVLPANNLRFTIVFSKPMRGGAEIFEQIRILDDKGKEIDDPWLLEEIWSPDGTRLILYIHPGRIKWGVLLRELLGPVLLPDRRYRLVISPEMRDGDGQKLGKEFSKSFRTIAEDRARIELKDWKIKAPATGSTQGLVVEMPKAIDQHSLRSFLFVCDAAGNQIKGKATPGKDQKTWEFVPTAAWQSEDYYVLVDGRLEDLAGNTPARPFDLDLTTAPQKSQDLSLKFRPAR